MLIVLLSLTSVAGEYDFVPPPVVGGHQADADRWPDAAGIVFGHEVDCTGVLVHPKVVLTAGHCAGGITDVILGTNNYDHPGEKIGVRREIAYPNWQSTYDITMLILEEEAETPPRLIASGCVLDENLEDGADVAIVGYGAIDEWGNQYTPKLMEAFTEITDYDCTDMSNGCQSSVSPGGELGAGGDGTDACYGDSGGPLYLLTDSGDYVVGLTSRGYDWVSVPCRDGGIYVRPDAVIDWIEEQAGVTLDRPTCNAPPEPVLAPIETREGQAGTSRVIANDPDEGDRHTFAVVEEPEHGAISFDGADVTYDPDGGYTGTDSAVIAVTDNGVPPLTAEVDLDVTVLTRKEWRDTHGGCGCASHSPAGAWLLAPLLLLLRRRVR